MKDKKIIINVGRQIGSGGRLIAERLAAHFGCRFYDRELLNLAAKESGFCEEFFEKNDEQKGFFSSILHIATPHLGDSNFYSDSISQESLFKIQSDAIRKAVSSSSCVFVGRCADYVLRDYPNVVNVFITADMDKRLQQVCARKGCDRATARKLIVSGEKERAQYYNYYTGKRWGHSDSYHLCVNSSVLGLEGTERLIEQYVTDALHLADEKSNKE